MNERYILVMLHFHVDPVRNLFSGIDDIDHGISQVKLVIENDGHCRVWIEGFKCVSDLRRVQG